MMAKLPVFTTSQLTTSARGNIVVNSIPSILCDIAASIKEKEERRMGSEKSKHQYRTTTAEYIVPP